VDGRQPDRNAQELLLDQEPAVRRAARKAVGGAGEDARLREQAGAHGGREAHLREAVPRHPRHTVEGRQWTIEEGDGTREKRLKITWTSPGDLVDVEARLFQHEIGDLWGEPGVHTQ